MLKNICPQMIRVLSNFILKKIICWKVIGSLPSNEKYVIAVVPHSSYFDLIIAVLIRTYSDLKIKFIGKKELFNPITSSFFKFLGGIPVSYTLICTFWIVPWLIAYFFGWVTVALTVICSILGAVAFTYLGYAYCQCLWLGLYFCFAKHEMPVIDRTVKVDE